MVNPRNLLWDSAQAYLEWLTVLLTESVLAAASFTDNFTAAAAPLRSGDALPCVTVRKSSCVSSLRTQMAHTSRAHRTHPIASKCKRQARNLASKRSPSTSRCESGEDMGDGGDGQRGGVAKAVSDLRCPTSDGISSGLPSWRETSMLFVQVACGVILDPPPAGSLVDTAVSPSFDSGPVSPPSTMEGPERVSVSFSASGLDASSPIRLSTPTRFATAHRPSFSSQGFVALPNGPVSVLLRRRSPVPASNMADRPPSARSCVRPSESPTLHSGWSMPRSIAFPPRCTRSQRRALGGCASWPMTAAIRMARYTRSTLCDPAPSSRYIRYQPLCVATSM
ncbi:hypothetical protein B0H10DRAFT_13338 [Mycena sp. CBHHK59/15]|nr:hypothetical protein B0H10DRAFT_13338 [Mycena sp. CBHHK59/15]